MYIYLNEVRRLRRQLTSIILVTGFSCQSTKLQMQNLRYTISQLQISYGRYVIIDRNSDDASGLISLETERRLKNRAIEQSSVRRQPIGGQVSCLADLAGGQIALHSNYTTLHAQWKPRPAAPRRAAPASRLVPPRFPKRRWFVRPLKNRR